MAKMIAVIMTIPPPRRVRKCHDDSRGFRDNSSDSKTRRKVVGTSCRFSPLSIGSHSQSIMAGTFNGSRESNMIGRLIQILFGPLNVSTRSWSKRTSLAGRTLHLRSGERMVLGKLA